MNDTKYISRAEVARLIGKSKGAVYHVFRQGYFTPSVVTANGRGLYTLEDVEALKRLFALKPSQRWRAASMKV